MRVAVGSLNSIKIDAVSDAVARALGMDVQVEPVRADSGVPEQPWGDQQTLAGAATRARASRDLTAADVGVGIEAGLVELPDGAVESVSWVVAAGVTADGVVRRGQSRAASYLLPGELADLVREGLSLGQATRQFFANEPASSGTIGPLTAGSIDRLGHYTSAVLLALIPFYPSNRYLTFLG